MGVVRVKDGVAFARIAPGGFEMLACLNALAGMQADDLTITCGTDSHVSPDPHVRGEAYDISVQGLTGDQILTLCQKLATSLGPKFTVLYENPSGAQALQPTTGTSWNPYTYINAGATGSHLHIQVKIGQTYP